MAVTVKPTDVSGVTSCILVCGSFQDWAATLMIVIVCSAETSVVLYSITQLLILEATQSFSESCFVSVFKWTIAVVLGTVTNRRQNESSTTNVYCF